MTKQMITSMIYLLCFIFVRKLTPRYVIHICMAAIFVSVSSEVHLLREQLNEANKTLKDVQKEKQSIETKAAKLVRDFK